MPTFPRYQSQATASTRQSSAEAVTDNSGEVLAQAGNQIGGAIQDATIKWSNAVDTIQKTTATANFKSGLLDITNRAANDPDYNNSDKYFHEIEKLKSSSLQSFTNKGAEAQAAMDFDYDGKVAQYQIQNVYKKKMIEVGQVSTMKLLDMEINNPGPDLEGRINAIMEQNGQLFDPKDAYRISKEYVKKGKFNGFLSDIQADPSVAETKLSGNSYEFDVKELRDAQAVYKTELGKIQLSNQTDLSNRYLNGEEIPPEELKTLSKQKKITPTFAESLIGKINNPRPDRPSKNAAFVMWEDRLKDMQEKGSKATVEEIVTMMGDVIKDHKDGLLDTADVKRILVDRDEVLQKKLGQKADDVMGVVRPLSWIDRMNFFVDEQAEFGLNKDDIKARMYRNLIDGISKGEDPAMLTSKIVNDEIELGLLNNLKKPDRTVAVNKETGQQIFSDDGGATWVDAKGNPVK